MREFDWLKVINSPFTSISATWYIGKTKIGVPYFYPRKWVKGTPDMITKAVLDFIEREKRYNKLNPNYAREIKSFEELYEERKNYNFAVPLKVGFSYCGLGWKTKWTDTDFRHEYSPILSFVFFGYQIAIRFYHEHGSHFWESWLYYEYATDHKLSKKERVELCKKEFPNVWRIYHANEKREEVINYYNLILKPKYKLEEDLEKLKS